MNIPPQTGSGQTPGLVRLVPGTLNTTLAPSALSEEQAADLLNCDTTRGQWEIDERYRRFKLRPTRTVTSGGIEHPCTEPVYADDVTAVARTGGNKTFSNVSNARISDNAYATASSISPGDKTELLYAESFVPTVEIPDEATDLVGTIRIEAQVDDETETVTDVVDDYIFVTLDGVAVGSNLATETPIEKTDTAREYEVDLSALSITPEMVRDGRVGVLAGWKAIPETAYLSGDYPLVISGVGNKTVQATTTAWSGSPPYSGDGGTHASLPARTREQGTFTVATSGTDGYVIVSLTATQSAASTTLDSFPGGTSVCPVSCTNSLGGSDVHTGLTPQSAALTTTAKKRIVVSSGTGQTTVDVDSDAQVTAGPFNNQAHCTASVDLSASVVQPDPSTLKVDSFTLAVCYTIDEGVVYELEGAAGIGIGSFGGTDEVAAIWGQGAFDTLAGDVDDAADADWSTQRANKVLELGDWFIWQYGKWLFYSNPDDGVYYRSIGQNDWTTLYKDSQSPGSTGDATAASSVPPYDDYTVFDPSADTVTGTYSGASSGTAVIATTGHPGYVQVTVSGADGWVNLEIALDDAIDLSKSDALYFQIAAGINDQTQDGFRSGVANNYIRLESATTASSNIATELGGRINVREGDYRAWADITGVSTAIRSAVKKIIIRFGTYMYKSGADYELRSLKAGGVRFHNSSGSFKDDTTTNTASTEYAYWYSETGQPLAAKSLIVAPTVHLGSRSYTGLPYLGSIQTITVPIADSPYTSAATIILARKVGAAWQRVATGANTESLVFIDSLRDATIAADTTTYPVVVPDFGTITPEDSGSPTGIVCGCAWKGSNIYSGKAGKIYMSRTNDPTEVEWDNVVLTNDPGSDDLGPPRTSVLADNTADYAVALVPAENLYCFTTRECYAFVSGDTAYNSSFPRKLDGVRGALGTRAACVYGDRALVGSIDGLWTVKKASDVGFQPDELVEITRENRRAWKTFLGDSPSTVIVRQFLGHIWCFNGSRYYHVTREGRHIPGQWADGAEVVDAVSDPLYGMLVQLSSGALGVVGPFPTDGGATVAGDDGVAPTWSYTTGRNNAAGVAERADVWYSSGDQTGVLLECIGQAATISLQATEGGESVISGPFDRSSASGLRRELSRQYRITGLATDTVATIELEVGARKVPRMQGRES